MVVPPQVDGKPVKNYSIYRWTALIGMFFLFITSWVHTHVDFLPNKSLPVGKNSPRTPQLDTSYLWANPQDDIMQRLAKLQFPLSCKNKRFIVYRLDKMATRNVGSIVTQIAHWLAEALMTDRILIFGPEPWEMADCQGQTWQCYFKPISSCSWKDLPENYKTIELFGQINQEKIDAEIDIPVITATRQWWRAYNDDIKQRLHVEAHTFHAYCYAFMMRLNNGIMNAVEKNLKVLMQKYSHVRPEKSISMPLRRGDKCRGHSMGHSAPGEDDCLSLQTYIDLINKFRCERFGCDPRKLSTLIVTCGEEAVVRNMSRLGPLSNWEVVVNDFDIMQGTGSANALAKEKDGVSTREVIISIFTSLQLQLRGKYFVKKRPKWHSSWVMLIEEFMTKIPDMTIGNQTVEVIELWKYINVEPRRMPRRR